MQILFLCFTGKQSRERKKVCWLPRAAVNKVLQTGWLKTTQIYSSSSGGRESEIKLSVKSGPSGASEEESAPGLSPSSWWFPGNLQRSWDVHPISSLGSR